MSETLSEENAQVDVEDQENKKGENENKIDDEKDIEKKMNDLAIEKAVEQEGKSEDEEVIGIKT